MHYLQTLISGKRKWSIVLGWRGFREGAAGGSLKQNRLRGLSEPCSHPRTVISRHCDIARVVPETTSFGSKGSGSERSRDQEIKETGEVDSCRGPQEVWVHGECTEKLEVQDLLPGERGMFCPCTNDPFGTLSHVLHVRGARR